MATLDEIRKHYDSFAWIYRTFWGDHIHHGLFLRGNEMPHEAQLNLLKHCAHLSDVRPGTRVLDVGCGHGGTCVYLARRYDCYVEGLTLSPKQVLLAKRNAKRARVEALTRFLVADVETHVFPTATFDLLWNMESSEHFRDKPNYFRRAAQSLRPGGRLLLTAWTGSMRRARVSAVANAFLCPALQTTDEYARQIEQAGLSIRSCQDLTQQVVRTWEICLARARKLRAFIFMLPRDVHKFVRGISAILEAYRSGDLTYSVIVAERKAVRNRHVAVHTPKLDAIEDVLCGP